jgi:periplasmic divalent cation tolerance protein
MDREFCIVMTTSGSEATTRRIVDRLLGDRLAACVQVLPVRSHFVWNGAVRDEAEELLIIKAKSADYPALEAAIRAAHDYEVPEILQIDVRDGSQSYLDWIRSTTL